MCKIVNDANDAPWCDNIEGNQTVNIKIKTTNSSRLHNPVTISLRNTVGKSCKKKKVWTFSIFMHFMHVVILKLIGKVENKQAFSLIVSLKLGLK